MANTQQIQDWFNDCVSANNNAVKGVSLAGLLVKHDDLIKAAIAGSLDKDKENRVKAWIVKQLPVSNNAQLDASCFETAWIIYFVSKLQELDQNENFKKREADFLTDIRMKYLEKRGV